VKVNYFDLGLYHGTELKWMVENVLPSLNVDNYMVYGFEACKNYADRLENLYCKNEKVQIINKAISNKNEPTRLYYAANGVGHSIFSTKNNVSKDYENIEGVVFSEWLKSNVADYDKSINILKVNIEGAEWHLFKDLVETGLHKHIDIFCGQGHDVQKVGELKEKIGEYHSLLEENNIHLYRFTEWRPNLNDDIQKLIKRRLVKKNVGVQQ